MGVHIPTSRLVPGHLWDVNGTGHPQPPKTGWFSHGGDSVLVVVPPSDRPSLLQCMYCSHVVLRNLLLQNPAFWNTHFYASSHVLVTRDLRLSWGLKDMKWLWVVALTSRQIGRWTSQQRQGCCHFLFKLYRNGLGFMNHKIVGSSECAIKKMVVVQKRTPSKSICALKLASVSVCESGKLDHSSTRGSVNKVEFRRARL